MLYAAEISGGTTVYIASICNVRPGTTGKQSKLYVSLSSVCSARLPLFWLFLFTKITTISLGIYLFILLWLLPKIKQINIAFFKDMSS